MRTFPGTVEFVKPGLDKGVALRRYAERMANGFGRYFDDHVF